MKKSLTLAVGSMIGFAAIAIPAVSFAASVTLTNGGLGQVASNPSQFGVAICNGGSKAVSQSVPVSVSTNGQSVTVSSAASIAAGACEYSNVSYDQLGMQAGQTYSVVVTINSGNQATYSVTVPGTQATAMAPMDMGTANTADVNAQSGNIFVMLWHWFTSLF